MELLTLREWVYTFESTNESGCTHTATLNLTINNSSSSQKMLTACDSFDWNGVTYTESGVYIFESTNESGCTHIATLNLTINNSSSSRKMLRLVIVLSGMVLHILRVVHIHLSLLLLLVVILRCYIEFNYQ